MAGSTLGQTFRLTTWGESHGKGIGGVIDGCPPGVPLSEADIQPALDRRRTGQSNVTTSRQEDDRVEILSGVFEGKTTGTPLSLIIHNKDQQSQDYEALKKVYRPQHADEAYDLKYGFRDHRGGGRSSARETAIRVAAGAVAQKMFRHLKLPTRVVAYTQQIGDLMVKKPRFDVIEKNSVRAADLTVAAQMEKRILTAKKAGNSLGGVIEVTILNCPVGLGEPVFDKLKADFAKAFLSINAVLGFEYGAGFGAATLKGSENNTRENGMYGGISNGKPIVMRVAIKPTSSIQLEKSAPGAKRGRHDPCLLPRAVPIVEAMSWLVLADHYLRQRATRLD